MRFERDPGPFEENHLAGPDRDRPRRDSSRRRAGRNTRSRRRRCGLPRCPRGRAGPRPPSPLRRTIRCDRGRRAGAPACSCRCPGRRRSRRACRASVSFAPCGCARCRSSRSRGRRSSRPSDPPAPPPRRRGALRAPARMARARVLRLHPLQHQHVHRQGVGIRRRVGGSSSTRPRSTCRQWAQRRERRGDEGADPHREAPRRLHVVAEPPYGAIRSRRVHGSDGKGDLVGELARACRRSGSSSACISRRGTATIADYGRPAYLDYYRAQLRELLTQYGPLFEVWFDGANGGDGYYGGARETRGRSTARPTTTGPTPGTSSASCSRTR